MIKVDSLRFDKGYSHSNCTLVIRPANPNPNIRPEDPNPDSEPKPNPKTQIFAVRIVASLHFTPVINSKVIDHTMDLHLFSKA